MQILQIIFIIFFPGLVIMSTRLWKRVRFISPLVVCYAIGIILGNINFIPVDHKLAATLSEGVVPLAMPLILFSIDFRKWARMAGKTILSFFLMIISVLASSALAFFLFSHGDGELRKMSGMLTALYTGGTANLMAVGLGLQALDETIALTVATTTILGGVYLLFLLAGIKWLGKKSFSEVESNGKLDDEDRGKTDEIRIGPAAAAFGLSAAVVAVSAGVTMLVTGRLAMDMLMLVLTSLGIAASFIKKVRHIKGTYELGQYLMLVFVLAVGININLGQLLSSSYSALVYTSFTLIATVIIHLVLSALFRIDMDTAIITSTAGLFGPATTGMVAGSFKNREILVSGLTCALTGYAVGTYLGMGLAMLLIPK